MLYIIGTGLDKNSITAEGLSCINKSEEVFMESYTADLPYSVEELSQIIGKEIKTVTREQVESEVLVMMAKEKDVTLLVYGSPLFATTHMSIMRACEKENISTKTVFSVSVFDAVAKTGLSMYKFGKVCSIPKYQKNYEPESFADIISDNQKINAHTLLLFDISLESAQGVGLLKSVLNKWGLEPKEIILCSRLGCNDEKIYFGPIDKIHAISCKKPYCAIIPGKLNFMEKEALARFSLETKKL